MPNYRKQAFRRIKKELDRFPNTNILNPLSLGDIGFYNSREAKFYWRRNIKELQVPISPKQYDEQIPTANELYTSSNAVNFEFVLDEHNIGYAKFNFSKSYSLVSQAIGLTTERYEVFELEQLLLEKIKSKIINWNPKWIIITQLYKSPSFSLIISKSKEGYAEIKTNEKLNQSFFNIADPSLKLTLSKSKKIAYQIIGEKNITPFFNVHRFKGNWKTFDLKLVPY